MIASCHLRIHFRQVSSLKRWKKLAYHYCESAYERQIYSFSKVVSNLWTYWAVEHRHRNCYYILSFPQNRGRHNLGAIANRMAWWPGRTKQNGRRRWSAGEKMAGRLCYGAFLVSKFKLSIQTFDPSIQTFDPSIQTFNPSIQICNYSVQTFDPSIQTFNPSVQIWNAGVDSNIPSFNPNMELFVSNIRFFNPNTLFFNPEMLFFKSVNMHSLYCLAYHSVQA